jgi:inner membrane protein
MPTILTHAVAAGILAQAARSPRLPRWTVPVAAVCAMLPDADVVAFSLGVPYDSVLGHRGLTHSIAAAVLLATAIVAARHRDLAARDRRLLWVILSLATVSHGLLDTLTDGGRGVALLAPFESERFFSRWRPIAVSPIGGRFFTARAPDGTHRWIGVLVSEILWIWVPALLIRALAGRRRRATIGPSLRA